MESPEAAAADPSDAGLQPPTSAAGWLAIFGPGAVIASLTIGAGELIFSSRGGALFGYRLLWLFALILFFKWVLVFSSARHIVLTGAHPFQRWQHLPGPRGWFPLVFFILALICFPIWVAFHAGTIGTLLSALAGTTALWQGTAYYLWGTGVLGLALLLVFRGGYQTLERTQLVITLLMLGSVTVSLFFIPTDWLGLLKGLLIPQLLHYPDWITPATYPEIAARPVWVETATYVGIIGGSSYDYLAYVSYLREKHWGRAGSRVVSGDTLAQPSRENDRARAWIRAPLVDCTLSFAAVFLFTAVFVSNGAVVLGPAHQVPGGSDLLSPQAAFVSAIHPWLRYLYFVGAFLTLFGTLYGTIEVAPTVLREMALVFPGKAAPDELRRWAVTWAGLGGLVLLVGRWIFYLWREGHEPPGLIALLTPANLFTGVLGCGLICLLNIWMDYRFLPRGWRMGRGLLLLNLSAAIVFLGLGLKGYWDYDPRSGAVILAATIVTGWLAAKWRQKWVVGKEPKIIRPG